MLPSDTATAPSVHFTYPPRSLLPFSLSALQHPQVLSPPNSASSLARPFNIDPGFYNNSLHVAVPITVAIIYATTVRYVNGLNRQRRNKPWPFSKSLAFYAFIITHNVFLAMYSGWTFIGMFNAIKQAWPGLDGEYGLAGAADALCKMHGPRGLGSAATFTSDTGAWRYTDRAMKLAGGYPDSTDVGRIWNEGLAFYGWLFYLSKFYEVVDTAIILAKGKRSSILQSYHHAGSMMCMWAGIRFMSPPIWMFVFINSGLHALMYTYYTLTALAIPVPRALKHTLTTLQISQFVFGASYAVAHLFVAYDIPVPLAYRYIHNLPTAVPNVSSTVSSALASATASVGLGSWLKKAALRAAGEEGLAENVRNYKGETFGIDAVHAAQVEKAHEEIRYRIGYQKVHCLDTSGETFAIMFNAIYLAFLIYLFVIFFANSFSGRAQVERPKPSAKENAKESFNDAQKDVQKEIKEAMAEQGYSADDVPPTLKAKATEAKDDIEQGASEIGKATQNGAKNLSSKAKKGAEDLSNKAKDAAGDLPAKAQNGVSDMSSKARKGAEDISHYAIDAAGDLPSKAQKGAEDLTAKTKKGAMDAKEAVKDDLKALQEKMRKMGKETSESEEARKSEEKDDNNEGLNGQTEGDASETDEALKSEDKDDSIEGLNGQAKEEAGEEESKSESKDQDEDKDEDKDKDQDQDKNKDNDEDTAKHQQNGETSDHQEDDQGFNGDSNAFEVVPSEPERKPSFSYAQPKNHQENDKQDDKPDTSGEAEAKAYEVVPDEPKSEEEKKAEEEMQPNQG